MSVIGHSEIQTAEIFEKYENKFALVNIVPDSGEVVLENNR